MPLQAEVDMGVHHANRHREPLARCLIGKVLLANDRFGLI